MTDNEIIKGCDGCPHKIEINHYRRKIQNQKQELRRLNEKVAEQQAENKELKTKNLILSQKRFNIFERIEFTDKLKKQLKSEAIKEFEYKLLDVSHLRIPQKIYPDDIHKIKKEMVGEG